MNKLKLIMIKLWLRTKGIKMYRSLNSGRVLVVNEYGGINTFNPKEKK